MKTTKIHYKYSGPWVACGKPGTHLSHTSDTTKVTCKSCRETNDFKIGVEVRLEEEAELVQGGKTALTLAIA